jgi:hypothetical protein
MTSSVSQEQPDRVNVDAGQVQEIYNNYGVSVPDLEHALIKCLQERGWERSENSEAFRGDLQRSFEDAYLQETGKIVIPDALDAAAEDATYWVNRHLSTDNGAPLDQVAPAFTALVGSLVPEYSRRGLDPHGTAQFLSQDSGENPQSN